MLKVETWPVDRLIPYARNPRKNDAQVDRMAAAIHEFGFRIPVVAKSGSSIVQDNEISPTVVSTKSLTRFCDGHKYSNTDYIHCQTFPEDYDFCGQSVQYVCGMSVPPVMMAQIASQIYEQWFKKQDVIHG